MFETSTPLPATRQIRFHRRVVRESMVDQSCSLSGVQQLRAKADQAACRDTKCCPRIIASRCHLCQFATTLADQFHNTSQVLHRNLHIQRLERFMSHASLWSE